jgi:transcriptional regulator with XRE-family HTH domain
MNTLGARLKAQRERLKLSMGDLAEKSGLSKGYINNLEKGRIEAPGDDALKKLAATLGLSFEDLLLLNSFDRVESQRGSGIQTVNGSDPAFQNFLKARFGIHFTVLSPEEVAAQAWKGEYSRAGSLAAHPDGTLSILKLKNGRLWQVIDPCGENAWPFPAGIIEGARSLVRIEDDGFAAFGYQAGDALFVRPVSDQDQIVGKKVIVWQGERHIIGVFRRDDVGAYLEAPPGSTAPWRTALEPGVQIEAEVLAVIKRE